jgi:type IV pilus assembly protein PilX
MIPSSSVITSAGRKSDHGFALVVALLLMVALSLVGIASLRGTALQEKMSGNLYFRSLAFQEAEGALRSTVAKIDSKIGLSTASPITALSSDVDWKPRINVGSNNAYWSLGSSWTSTGTRINSSALTVNATTEDIGDGPQLPSCEKKIGANACQVKFTRMTTRAIDPATGAAIIVQQHWSFPIAK